MDEAERQLRLKCLVQQEKLPAVVGIMDEAERQLRQLIPVLELWLTLW
ncbi:hypothetical protein MFUM_700028 [Methylacidiphilum fumariolicum SolV]|uniref:Uncharacterized protein n=2 Tax=Candidatus Methylacidiphilum fumarolicum TaxID=591154 RepID=I0JZ10_METFB|nr:conserved protein of unknown function [Candidatus Methylacidiphilum fumarolicum]CCG92479.1 hypothetical protein MFUM_700028 [Methylacidiphilum fumariolicum SolV]